MHSKDIHIQDFSEFMVGRDKKWLNQRERLEDRIRCDADLTSVSESCSALVS